MTWSDAARAKARETREKKFKTPEDRENYYRTLSSAGAAARRARRQRREAAPCPLCQGTGCAA